MNVQEAEVNQVISWEFSLLWGLEECSPLDKVSGVEIVTSEGWWDSKIVHLYLKIQRDIHFLVIPSLSCYGVPALN